MVFGIGMAVIPLGSGVVDIKGAYYSFVSSPGARTTEPGRTARARALVRSSVRAVPPW